MVVNRPSMIRPETKNPFDSLQSFGTVHFHKSSGKNDRPLWTHSSTEISSKSGLRSTSTSSPYWIFKFLVSVHELKLGRPGCFKDENEGSKELGRRGRRVDVLRSPDQNQPFLIFEGVSTLLTWKCRRESKYKLRNDCAKSVRRNFLFV